VLGVMCFGFGFGVCFSGGTRGAAAAGRRA